MKYVVHSPIDQYANEAVNGPIARARACKLRKIPKIVPFSLSKPYFDAKLLITLITILDAK